MKRSGLAAIAAAVALVLATVARGGPPPHGGTVVNDVESIAMAAQPTVAQAVVDVVTVPGPSNHAGNYAYAHGQDCTGCRAVALAYQVVFATGKKTDSEPQNIGLATNDNCDSCFTVALAFQDVVPVDHPFKLTPSEQAQIDSIAARAQALATSGLTDPAELDQQAQALRDELWADIALDVQRHGHQPHGPMH